MPQTDTDQADFLRLCREDPAAALEAVRKERAQRSLREFARLMWPVLEPETRPLITGWAMDAICEHLQAVTDGQIRKLLINVPPGCMKSLLTSVLWPAWEWGPRNLPATRYVCASYAEHLSVRDNRKCRNVIRSDIYRKLWGDRFSLTDDQNQKLQFATDKTGFKLATSVSGVGTGERGDRFIIDDPHNVKEAESEAKREAALQWFTEVVPTRINDPERSAIVIIMQRVHTRDVSGLILAGEMGYDVLCLPMEYEVPDPLSDDDLTLSTRFTDPRSEPGELLWPERFSRRYLEDDLKPSLRAWGGTYAEAGQLQQRPSPRGGGMFKRADFQVIDAPPTNVVKRVRGWDLAGTDKKKNPRAKYTAGVKMALGRAGEVYIEDVRRGQWGPLDMERNILAAANQDGPGCEQSLPQDPGQAGKHQVRALAALLHGHKAHFSTESGDKETRATPLAAQVQGGNVFLVRAAWNDAFLSKVASFPTGDLSDQVDGASRAYARLIAKRAPMVGAAPRVIKQAGGRFE